MSIISLPGQVLTNFAGIFPPHRMRMLLRTFQLALPSLWHVGSVLFLVFFVFAVLGMHLLGNAAHGGMIDDRINFETFGSSMFVLFFSLTGENWPSVLHDLLAQVCPTHLGSFPTDF